MSIPGSFERRCKMRKNRAELGHSSLIIRIRLVLLSVSISIISNRLGVTSTLLVSSVSELYTFFRYVKVVNDGLLKIISVIQQEFKEAHGRYWSQVITILAQLSTNSYSGPTKAITYIRLPLPPVIIVCSFGQGKGFKARRTPDNPPIPTKIGNIFIVYQGSRTEYFILS